MSKQIKYSDKSSGQPDLLILFNELKEILRPFARGNYKLTADKPGHYEIYYGNEVKVLGKNYSQLMFASLLIQKGYIGFYFFPIYIDETLKTELASELLSCLKGKTCFHIKKYDKIVMAQIQQALELGVNFYSSKGWRE